MSNRFFKYRQQLTDVVLGQVLGQLQRRCGLSLAIEGCSDFARSPLAKQNMGAAHRHLADIGYSQLGL